jgi:hypothetical protein
VDDAIGSRILALISTGGSARAIAQDDKLNDLALVSVKRESENQRFWQPSLVKSAVDVSGNDAISVIVNSCDNGECQLVADNLASDPVADSRASSKFAKSVVHQCSFGKGSHKSFEVRAIDRVYEGGNGRWERGSLQFKGFKSRTGIRHRFVPRVALRAGEAKHQGSSLNLRFLACYTLRRVVKEIASVLPVPLGMLFGP